MGLLEKLRKRLEEILKSMKTLSDGVVAEDGAVRSFSTDEDSKYKELEKDLVTVKAAITREEDQEEARSIASRLNDPASPAPRAQIVREENHNEDGEYRGFKHIGEFLRAVAMESSPGKESLRDKRLPELQRSTIAQARASGMSENIGAEGGFLIQSDFQQQLQTKSFAESVFAPLCQTVEISSNSNELVWNELIEDSRVTGSRYGGVRVFRDKEAGTVASSFPKLRRDKLVAEKMTAIAYATEEILQDASALGSLIEPQFTHEMGFVLDEEILTGDGDGECFGVLNHPSLITITKESGQAANTVLFANVRKMHGRIWAGSELSAIWFVGSSVVEQLETMAFDPAATNTIPVYLPANGASDKRYGTMYGAPVRKNEHSPALSSAGDILYADFSQYRIVKKGGIVGAVSQHVRFINGENTFRWTQRVNGKPLWRNPVTPAKQNASEKEGPFIALGAR